MIFTTLISAIFHEVAAAITTYLYLMSSIGAMPQLAQHTPTSSVFSSAVLLILCIDH
jgi:hypothetical protein